jgi:phospholipid/cholesterol/gamma-HCH transport system ATP-binding protein
VQHTDRKIISFEQVMVLSDSSSATMVDVSFTLGASELALLHTRVSTSATPLGDACAGLCEAVKGRIRYLDRDWRDLSDDRANALRGTISQIPSEIVWVSNLSMAMNIMLRELHHTSRPLEEVRAEATRLAQSFGLPGLPTGNAVTMCRADLQRAALTRAFLGSPTLLVMQNPTEGIHPGIMAPLLNAVRRLRTKGSAVIWITGDDRVWRNPAIGTTLRLEVIGSRFFTVE